MTPERVERATLLLAVIISQRSPEDAAVLAPIFDRLERELDGMQNSDVKLKAQRRIELYKNTEAVKAIAS